MSPSLGEALQKASEEGYALGAFNTADIVTLRAVIQAASALSSPVVIETSPGETRFLGVKNLVSLVKNFRRETGLPLFINLDHASSLSEIKEAIKAGFDLVHFDGSAFAFEENVVQTMEVVTFTHQKGVLVEGEIDRIRGESRLHKVRAETIQAGGLYTEPEKAATFVKSTGVDILAVFVGNLHGVYQTPIKLDRERLKLIKEKVPCFLSLHGGSGTEVSDLEKAIKTGGIVKINVNTDLRIAYREALEKSLEERPEELAGYRLFAPVMEAVQKVVEEKIKIFGSAGKA